MAQALRQLAEDFLSTILFFAIYALSGSLTIAVLIAMAAGAAQVLRLRLLQRRIEPMQWMSLGLVVVFGTATILAGSPRLMMAKPSVIHTAIAAVMLRPGWMTRYLPPIARDNLPERVVVAAGYGWAALLFALACLNLVVAMRADFAAWAWFAATVLPAAKLAAFAVQYAAFRGIVRRRLLLASAPATTG